MNALNENQVRELFQRESVFVGGENIVPVFRAIELFGDDAVKYATRPCFGVNHYNIFSTEDGNLEYLRRRGFDTAASYYNVKCILRISHDKIEGRKETNAEGREK